MKLRQKKNIAVTSLVTIGVFTAFTYSCKKDIRSEGSTDCIPGNLTGNVIAFYPFSNGSINDMSGNSYNLINSGGASATADRNGNNNCAIQFTNDSASVQFLQYSNPVFLNNLPQFSISLWYEITTGSVNGTFAGLVNRGSDTTHCPDRMGQWSVGIYDCRRAVFGRTNSVWDTMTDFSNCPFPINTWHHLVATYNSAGTVMTIYRDGILQESKNGDADCGPWVPLTVQDIGDLFLGRNFTGKLDDVIILNKELNQQEVTSLFTAGSCCQ